MAKHVMMSQPPGSGAGRGPSIGNYKGVMLCNRPFAGVQAAAAAATNSSSAKSRSAAFKAGIPDGRGTLGLNPTKKLLPHAKPKKRITAVGRHKKWLQDLQEQKRVLEDEILDEEETKELRRKAFSERERQKRQLVNKGNTNDTMNAGGSAEGKTGDGDTNGKDETKDWDEPEELDRLISQKQEVKVTKRNKPAWAYTEASKMQEDEEMEDEELQELLDFTNNLNFEEFIEDVEVKQALEQLRQRVENLTPRDGEDQKERMQRVLAVARTEVDGKDLLMKAGIKVLRPLTEEALDQLQRAMNGASNERPRDDDAMSVLSESSILSDAKSLRSVHSKRSIAQIRRRLDKSKAGGGGGRGMRAIEEASYDLPSCPEPVIVTESAVRQLKKNFEASRLPYIHRNPAV